MENNVVKFTGSLNIVLSTTITKFFTVQISSPNLAGTQSKPDSKQLGRI